MPPRKTQAMHGITERQKLSMGSYHAGQKAVFLINWILANLATCLGWVYSVTYETCCHHHCCQAPLHHKGVFALSEKTKEPQESKVQVKTSLKKNMSVNSFTGTKHFQWVNMYCLFWLFTKTHLNTLSVRRNSTLSHELILLIECIVYVRNTVSKPGLVSVYWHRIHTTSNHSKWKLLVVKKLLQYYFMLLQKRLCGSYVFLVRFKNRNIIQLHIG